RNRRRARAGLRKSLLRARSPLSACRRSHPRHSVVRERPFGGTVWRTTGISVSATRVVGTARLGRHASFLSGVIRRRLVSPQPVHVLEAHPTACVSVHLRCTES